MIPHHSKGIARDVQRGFRRITFHIKARIIVQLARCDAHLLRSANSMIHKAVSARARRRAVRVRLRHLRAGDRVLHRI